MNNPTLNQIKNSIVADLQRRFGYCGCAEGPNQVMLNSGAGDDNFIITIKDQSAIDAEAES